MIRNSSKIEEKLTKWNKILNGIIWSICFLKNLIMRSQRSLRKAICPMFGWNEMVGKERRGEESREEDGRTGNLLIMEQLGLSSSPSLQSTSSSKIDYLYEVNYLLKDGKYSITEVYLSFNSMPVRTFIIENINHKAYL